MTPRDRDYIGGLCAQLAGLSLDTDRAYLMESRLGALARREAYGSVADLVRAVRERGEERLVWAVVEALAPSQTAFFRDPDAFEALAEELAATAGAGPSRVWSAACGPGQEIYSLAMLLEERGIEGVELFASDLSEVHLEKARAGLYSAFEVQQGLSARRLVRHFTNADEGFLIDEELRRQVRWRRINLVEPPRGLGSFDLILCRHVLGSLLLAAQESVVANLLAALKPGGRLAFGADETPPATLGLVPVAGAPGLFEAPAGFRAAA
jgi:chemotaxis protein methyltransferase CheR